MLKEILRCVEDNEKRIYLCFIGLEGKDPMKGIKLHATRNHPPASASKRKAPKSRPSVAKKTKRDSISD